MLHLYNHFFYRLDAPLAKGVSIYGTSPNGKNWHSVNITQQTEQRRFATRGNRSRKQEGISSLGGVCPCEFGMGCDSLIDSNITGSTRASI
jgi:hypothetical protein